MFIVTLFPPTGSNFTASGEFKTTDGKTIEYSKDNLSLSAGNYKRLNVKYIGAPTTVIERALTVGDFYYSDGGILPCPQEEGVTVPSEGCIGIIYCTDPNRIDNDAKQALATKGVSSAHGLVMALTNASDGCRWGEDGKDEDGLSNTNTLQQQYNNISGYAETQWIIDTYKDSGNTLQDTYAAFYHANNYGKTTETEKYAAPGTTTGWFIPSMGQWWDILANLGRIDLGDYKTKSEDFTEISGAAPTAVNNMNTYLTKVSGATQFSATNTTFWSSSECKVYGYGCDACDVAFYNGKLNLGYISKSFGSYREVRCSLAF